MNDEQRSEAATAWQAYNAMETTKLRHFEFLTLLENKKKNFNLEATEGDEAMLKQLLRDHDEQVHAFTAASRTLKQQSPDTHIALFRYISELHESLGDSTTKH